MRVRTVLAVLVAAAVFGLLVALPLGRHRQISVELWLAGVAAWAGLGLLLRVTTATPVTEPQLRPLFRWLGDRDEPRPRPPRDLLAIDGILLAARENERAFVHRLAPRLRALADHRLRVDHGIDPDRDPDGAARVLGDGAWLVGRNRPGDPPVEGRTPTAADVEQLLDRLQRPRR